MISVIILTKNEAQDIGGCLRSVSWSDDIHLYDSFSTDDTVKIATEAGARVTQRVFDNWSAHQNWGLQNIPFKHPWVLYIDADERVTPGLKTALLEAAQNPGENVAFRVQRRDFFMGTWLKHVQATSFYIRLFRPENILYERLVNPITNVSGQTGDVTGFLDHFPFSKGISNWVGRHNSYSTFEAEQIRTRTDRPTKVSIQGAFLEKDPTARRAIQKELFYRMPMRPLVKFLLLYFLKGGFLDGKAGFRYSVLQMFYEYQIVLKTEEVKETID